MSSLARVLWLSLALAPWLTAQAPQAAGGNDRHPRRPAPMPAPLADPDTLWRVPLHTNAADPVAGPYGWWAGGRGYKASFHDGFVFYPYLGPDCPENLPLRWTTERVSAGGEAIADLRHCEHVHGAQRYEYRYGAVTERYDVRDDGVEQSFVIAASPARPGDLVVRGRVTSRLRCAPVGAAPQPLTFADEDGRAVVRYGEALAFDAAGERVPVATSFDGEAITLTVPAAWLARATWPVTVDPLTAPALVFSSTLPRISFTDVAHDLESHEILTVFGLEFSATDYDVRGFFVDNALGGVLQVYADLSSAYSNVHSQCCIVGGADKWAIATGREFNTGAANVAVYVHPRAFYTLNGGWTKLVTRGAVFDHHPSIGGSTHSNVNNKALLAWRR